MTSEANASVIAFVPTWSFSQEWNKFAEQKSVEIFLEKGKSYYMEGLMKEAGGGDNLAVGWRKPSDGAGTVPVEVIPGIHLSPAVGAVATKADTSGVPDSPKEESSTPEEEEVEAEVAIDNGVESTELALYPNPVVTEVQIDMRTSVEGLNLETIRVFDLTGRLVRELVPNADQKRSNQYQIDMNDLPSGYYSVILQLSDQSLRTYRLIKQ